MVEKTIHLVNPIIDLPGMILTMGQTRTIKFTPAGDPKPTSVVTPTSLSKNILGDWGANDLMLQDAASAFFGRLQKPKSWMQTVYNSKIWF